jgi:hypothetical protein
MTPTTEEPPEWLIPKSPEVDPQPRFIPPVFRYGFPLYENVMIPLAASVGYQRPAKERGMIKICEAGVSAIANQLGINVSRQSVLNLGSPNILELGNTMSIERISTEDIEKVKVMLCTDQDPTWFLDMAEYKWKTLTMI